MVKCIGVHRAERLMCTFFEERNHQKSVNRMGCKDYGTYQTEKLLHLNSYAKSIGYDPDQLPFEVSAPTTAPAVEYMGFAYRMPESVHDVSNPASGTGPSEIGVEVYDDLANEDEDGDDNAVDIGDDELMEIFGDDFDIEILLDEDEVEEPSSDIDDILWDINNTEQINQIDRRKYRKVIEREIQRLLPDNNNGRETTLQAFNRLNNQQSWIPFRMPDSQCPPTDVDKAEAELFDQWKDQYDLEATASTRTYHRFEKRWNNEVSRRFKDWTKGDDTIILLRLKSREQLVEYSKKCNDMDALHVLAPRVNDDDLNNLNSGLRATRRQLPTTADPHVCQPVQYPANNTETPLGNSVTALNAEVMHGAITAPPATNRTCAHRTCAPFVIVLPAIPPTAPPRPAKLVRSVFRSKKWCIICGWRKNEHGPNEGKGGRDKKGNSRCTRDFCGNCFQMKDEHDRQGVVFGPDCTFGTNQFCTVNVTDWFEQRVRLLYCSTMSEPTTCPNTMTFLLSKQS